MVILAGMIGVGKSTVAEAIGEHLGSQVFFESVDDNRILELFYRDKKRWAFTLQVYFLNTRFRSIKAALRHKDNVLDRSIYEDALFTRINYEEGNISDVEMDTYLHLLDNMMVVIEETEKGRPDLLVYLHGSFDTIMHRIRKRGREYEQSPELVDYLKHLHAGYANWIKEYDKSPVLIIDIDRYDIERSDDKAAVLRMVDGKLSELSSEFSDPPK
ncbi:deoxyadenosine kinase [Alicyclobacillus fastidiosus]|nr:deoxyadenosine kinase [Alicyclobacillus fastidiosus]